MDHLGQFMIKFPLAVLCKDKPQCAELGFKLYHLVILVKTATEVKLIINKTIFLTSLDQKLL